MRLRRPIVLLLAAAFAAKLVVLLELRTHPLLQPGAAIDTMVDATLAGQVLNGNWLLWPGLYGASPVYVYFFAAVLFFGGTFSAVGVAQIVLGTAAVGLVYLAARRWYGARAALFAGVLAALTGLFTFHEVLLRGTALDPFLCAAALAALAVALRGAGRTFAVAGVLFGVAGINRPQMLAPAVVVVLLLAATRHVRAAVLMTAGLAVVLATLAVRNGVFTGDWVPAVSHGGLAFYIGNSADATGTYRAVAGGAQDPQTANTDARHAAEVVAGKALSDAGVSSYYASLGRTWIRLHPRDAAALFLRKLRYVFAGGSIPLEESYPFFVHDVRSLLPLLFVGPWLLIPLGIVGFVLALPEERRVEYAIWLSFVPAYALATAAFYVSDTARLPLLVPFCVGAGAALDEVLARRRGFRPHVEGAALVAVLVLAVGVNWPTHLPDGRQDARTRMAEALIRQGNFGGADTWIAAAQQAGPDADVEDRVARAFMVRREPAMAAMHFERALAVRPNDPAAEYALGQALVDAGKPADAIPHLRVGLNAGVRVNLAGLDLARALGETGNRVEALQTLQTIQPDDPNDGRSWQTIGDLAMQLRDPSLAAACFNRAIAALPRDPQPMEAMGLALVALGRLPEAISNLQQAAALDPTNASAQLNLAVALAQDGRTDEARTHAQEALRLKPGYDRAQQLLRALK